MMRKKPFIRVVVFASGNGTNLQVIIDRVKSGELSASVVAVVSDQADAHALERARNENIQAIFVDPQGYSDRIAYDAALRRRAEELDPDLIVLAGFMRVLSAEFVRGFENRVMNIHPSLLPKYKGLNTHERVLAAGDCAHGATVHFVTEKLDDGPIIIQKRIRVLPTDTVQELKQRVHACEYEIYPRAIQWFADGYLNV